MRNIKMTIEYDGSNFKGFQKLKDNENTIQGKLESVLSQMAGENIEIIGSG
ncbi:MAG: tRNA pseudouridine(38-40) synthase TruA, partial [Intestinibacter bartlettii]|nr:tRNA pseudouridine(38-40) synthase TruA [Intestinibacter bartlettii]